MQKVYTFNTLTINGTVTVHSDTGIFSTRELAEQTRRDIIEANKNDDLFPLSCHCTEVKESVVYETKEEIPFYQGQ